MPEGNLHVFDSRTGKYYELPITRNAVRAQDINRIAAPPAGDSDPALKLAKGLRILDEGFQRTASHESKITWVYIDMLSSSLAPCLSSLNDSLAVPLFTDRWQ